MQTAVSMAVGAPNNRKLNRCNRQLPDLPDPSIDSGVSFLGGEVGEDPVLFEIPDAPPGHQLAGRPLDVKKSLAPARVGFLFRDDFDPSHLRTPSPNLFVKVQDVFQLFVAASGNMLLMQDELLGDGQLRDNRFYTWAMAPAPKAPRAR